MWSSDHRIEITSIRDSGTELTGQSGITSIRVFNASGTLIEEYAPMNPGQSANVQSDLSGLGDGYARFDTSVMKPTMGNTWLGQVMITNGTNTFSALPVTFQQGNGAYDIITAPQPMAAPLVAPCFGPDVRVTVEGKGSVAVSTLAPGDRILTDEGYVAVLWTGRRSHVCTLPHDWPVEVEGEIFSPLHRILRRDRWAKAKHLAEAGLATRRADIATINYHHILLPQHSVIVTERNRVESLLMTGYSLSLWDHEPALSQLMHASAVLRRAEWRRREVLAGLARAELAAAAV